MAAKAGRLQVQMEMDIAQIKRDLSSMNAEVKRASTQWKSDLSEFATGFKDGVIGALTGGAIIAAVSSTVKTVLGMFDEIADGAKKLQIDTTAYQELDYLAKQTGTSLDELAGAFVRMQKSIGEAQAGGASKFVESLSQMGIAIDDLKAKKPDEQFRTLIQGLADIGNPAQRAAAGAQVFGKQWATLGPLLAEGAEGIDEIIQRAHDLGIVMSDEAVQAGEAFNDQLDTMRLSILGLVGEAIAPALPVFTEMIAQVINVGKASGDATTEVASFGDMAKTVAGAVIDATAAVKNLGAAFTWVGKQAGLSLAAADIRIQGLKDAWQLAKDNASRPFDTTRKSPLEVIAEADKRAAALIKETNSEIEGEWKSQREAIEAARVSARKAIADTQFAATPSGATPDTTATNTNTEATKKNTAAKKANREERVKLTDEEKLYARQLEELNKLLTQITAEEMKRDGATEAEAEHWRILADGLGDLGVQVYDAEQKLSGLQDVNERNKQAAEDYKNALIDLTSEQMRANGATEQAIIAYREQALAYTDMEKKAAAAQRDVNALSDANRKRAEEALDIQRTLQQGVEDVFANIFNGAKSATEAVKRLLAQLLSVWATQKALGWLGLGTATGAANGAAFLSGGFRAFSQGGIVSSPTPFTFGGGQLGVMGEAGPEAILPLGRDSNGRLGVRGGGINVNVHNYSGSSIETQADGDNLDIVVQRVTDKLSSDIIRGGNRFATSFERTYQVRR